MNKKRQKLRKMKGRMKNIINVKGSGEMRRYEREKGWRSVNVKLKNIYIYIY